MTVIAAQVFDDRIEFAADSQTSRGWRKETSIGAAKIWHPQENLVIGASGLVKETVMMRAFSRRVRPARPDEEGIAEWILSFDDELRTKAKIGTDNSYLVGFDGTLWAVRHFEIIRIHDYYAIGSGSDFALPALMLGANVRQAVEAAIQFDLYCSGEIVEASLPR